MLEETLKPIIKMFLAGIIILLLLMFNFNNRYYRNIFEVTLNDKPLYLYYNEKYLRGPLPPIIGAYNETRGDNYPLDVVNKMEYSKNMNLDIKEYSVFWKDTNERTKDNKTWHNLDRYIYKLENLSDTHLIIKRKNKIIYEGKYIENISKYISEPGRYYFQAIATRKDNFYTNVITHMSFNVIIGGDNHE